MTLPHTFCSDVATKYLIKWCSFFTVIVQPVGTNKTHTLFDFCLTVHHQLGKGIQMTQLDATMIY